MKTKCGHIQHDRKGFMKMNLYFELFGEYFWLVISLNTISFKVFYMVRRLLSDSCVILASFITKGANHDYICSSPGFFITDF